MKTLLALLLTLALPLPAAAQSAPIRTVSGSLPGQRLGFALDLAGDADGDGAGEWIVGSPFHPGPNVQYGQAEVFSGQTSERLFTFGGEADLDHCGWAVAGAGDADGDGREDWLVGLPDSGVAAGGAGLARLHSGASGATLAAHPGAHPGERLASAVARLGDLDGDGVGDFAIAAPTAPVAGPDSGRVLVVSGASGAVLFVLAGAAAGDRFGIAVAAAGDADGDGTPDIVVGADQGGVGPGYARVVSGAGGALLAAFAGASPGERFGAAVTGIGDADGDGLDDIAVGAPVATVGSARPGAVRILSPSSAALVRTFPGERNGEAFGAALARAGDGDLDGSDDLLVGAPFGDGAEPGAGRAVLLSARTGEVLATFHGERGGDRFGAALSGGGDVDGDGVRDHGVGAPGADPAGTDSGRAYVFPGRVCAPLTYCTAKPNSLGCQPSIGWSGSPTLGGPDDFHVTATALLNRKNGMFFYGFGPASIPFRGGTLCAAPPLRRTPVLSSGGNPPPADCSGSFELHWSQAAMQAAGWSAGARVYGQFWSRDPSHPDGTASSLTDALEIRVCP